METINENRRRFERLALTEHAIAVDENGTQLGRVAQASGGGMRIDPASPEVIKLLTLGQRLRVNIVEPGSGTSTPMDVEIRHLSDTSIGMQFISMPASTPGTEPFKF